MLIVVFVCRFIRRLVRLYLLLPPLPLIKRICIDYRGNQFIVMFMLVYDTLTNRKVVLLTKLILW